MAHVRRRDEKEVLAQYLDLIKVNMISVLRPSKLQSNACDHPTPEPAQKNAAALSNEHKMIWRTQQLWARKKISSICQLLDRPTAILHVL